jgi:cardiolipin synthase A/B
MQVHPRSFPIDPGNSTAGPGDGFAIQSIERIFQARFSHATRVQLLWKGRESFEAIFRAVEEAERLICLQFYIFRDDETGRQLGELLKKKSRQEVGVYVLYDHFGSLGTPR